MNIRHRIFAAAALMALGVASFGQTPNTTAAKRPAELMVGDKAPALSVAKWVKGGSVNGLKKGNIYVVEFWATWCGPCKQSIPHLTELQKKFGSKATFVGVSSFEDNWDGVEPFVKQEGDQMEYHVAMDKIDHPKDRQGFMAKNWMVAAHQPGIPTAFVIDRDGKIAWIGHPMDMEESLGKIIDGTFDRNAFAATYAATMQKMIDEQNSPLNKLMAQYRKQAGAKQWKEALATIDEAEPMLPGKAAQANSIRLSLLSASGDAAGYSALGKKMVAGSSKDNAQDLNEIAWHIVDPKGNLNPRDLDLAKDAAERAVEVSKHADPAMLDTLAWTYHWLGDNTKATELETEALSKADAADRANYQQTLNTFKGL